MIHEKTYFTGTVKLNYAEIPNTGKDTILLLHGGSARWQYLENVMRDLATDYHIIAPDLRGHGLSDNTPYAYRIIDFADDIERLIHHLQRPVILFGHSLGGAVAVMTAARLAVKMKALIIADAPFALDNLRQVFVQQESTLKHWIRLIGKSKEIIVEGLKETPMTAGDDPTPRPAREVMGEDSLWFTDMAENLLHHDPTMLETRLKNFDDTHAGLDAETLFAQITCPTLLLQADSQFGGLMSDEEVALGKRILAKPYHVHLQGIGHSLFHENHSAVMDALREFLRQV